MRSIWRRREATFKIMYSTVRYSTPHLFTNIEEDSELSLILFVRVVLLFVYRLRFGLRFGFDFGFDFGSFSDIFVALLGK